MSKYVDAEKLIADIKGLLKLAQNKEENEGDFFFSGEIQGYKNIITIIDSLQPEQPEVDLKEEIASFFSNNPIPYEHITDWPLLKNTALHFFNHGLNARKDKLPEIELDKFTEKIKTFQRRYKHPEIVSIKGAMAFMARMFYQYPNIARQWYDSLPKTTMD